MDRQFLSQDEIDALLGDTESVPTLSPEQKDALGEIGNICYGTASTALSTLLNTRVDIATPTVFLATQKELMERYSTKFVVIEVNYKNGIFGKNILVLQMEDASIIADLMVGGEGNSPKQELTEMDVSAVQEAMNQMTGNAATSLAVMISKKIETEPPSIREINPVEDEVILKEYSANERLVAITFKLNIGELIDSELMLLVPYQLALEMADLLLEQIMKAEAPAVAAEAASSSGGVVEAPMAAAPSGSPPPAAALPPTVSQMQSAMPTNNPVGVNQNPQAVVNQSYNNNLTNNLPPNNQQVMVQPAQFGQIGAGKQNKEISNISLIMDVPLQVTVELGSARMKIKDVLELGLGSIVELDRLAGDPVDILVNGKLIAKGEVVVIDENFGIKVTDIISPLERANTLQ